MLRKNRCSFLTVKSYQSYHMSSPYCVPVANLKLQITHVSCEKSMGLFLVNNCFLISSSSLNLDLKMPLNHFTKTSTVNFSSVENISESADALFLHKTLVVASFSRVKVVLSKYLTYPYVKWFKS